MTLYERLNPGVNSYLLTNPTKGQSEAMLDDPKYAARGLEVIFTKRYSNRWQMIASYHYNAGQRKFVGHGFKFRHECELFCQC